MPSTLKSIMIIITTATMMTAAAPTVHSELKMHENA